MTCCYQAAKLARQSCSMQISSLLCFLVTSLNLFLICLLVYLSQMKEYLMDVHKFEEKNICLLMDDGINYLPTRANIFWAIQSLVRNSRSGDVVFTHFSGHGGRVKDTDGDEST